ncbi:hypothetical protein [Mesorhizobium sp. M1E.F.Ca.ET.063.01.1.1]|uniref:hypothetical protein n=1 Tax=Mesorhizobium sp. M1E.F.Ca.ET.063.01.1.1 TaxID=2496750 RepID=UPI000FCC9D11|nr:hypothetical protein [Mesorhizobium sp. M1E.F.Ca.ET.063.01.1.1]RUW85011.1 hypothetical protein EOA29_06855 [Mesorhizobium sp. M1E.F.Ca.ET.063.01.1.1]
MLTRRQRDIIASAMRSVIDEQVSEHFNARTQEHQLTSRIAGVMEKELSVYTILGRRMTVLTQEFPDKGKGSLEKPTGIDLYISIADTDENGFSKGIFVQAKWKEIGRKSKSLVTLGNQCKEMLARSTASYVWLYAPDGVEVVRAQEVVDQPGVPPESLRSRRADDLFSRILECPEGDRAWGVPAGLEQNERRPWISRMMEELRIRRAIDVTIGGPDLGVRRD